MSYPENDRQLNVAKSIMAIYYIYFFQGRFQDYYLSKTSSDLDAFHEFVPYCLFVCLMFIDLLTIFIV